jgi:hypothetical protein
MIIRVIKVLIGILLLPVTVAISVAFAAELGSIQIKILTSSATYFLKGVIIYLIMHLILYKPNYFYVLGHEAAHAIATFICGGKVRSLRISGRGGGILTNKSNFFVALFPYFFPIYTILLWLVYFLFSLFRNMKKLAPQFLFLMGFTLTMHIIMTIESMKIKQGDIFKTGYLFSVSLIFILNVLLVGFILSLVFQDFSFASFFNFSISGSVDIYRAICKYLFA